MTSDHEYQSLMADHLSLMKDHQKLLREHRELLAELHDESVPVSGRDRTRAWRESKRVTPNVTDVTECDEDVTLCDAETSQTADQSVTRDASCDASRAECVLPNHLPNPPSKENLSSNQLSSSLDESPWSGTELEGATFGGRSDDTFVLATSERDSDLSQPVSIGASRLVALVFRQGEIDDATRTVLRVKASEAERGGRPDNDISECLRIWRENPKLGPNALLCCMAEVDKRKLNHHDIPTSDRRVLEGAALKARLRNNRKEIESGY
jgi:hypothetical protein